jgi:two-component system chemotaxis sensor kinase CheA
LADMSPESQNLAILLEQLALKVVMLEEEDIQGLGSFLTQLEDLQAQVSQFQELAPLFQDMTEVGQRLVLREVETAARALELLGQGVSLLQTWTRHHEWPPPGEVWENYRLLARELGLGERETAAAPQAAISEAPVWDDPELVASFLPEAQEHLEGIETRLVYLEQHPDDLETINAIFRPFHTLKGVAGFLNLSQIQELSHEVEWLLDRVRDGKVMVSLELVNLVLETVDLLRAMLDDLQGSFMEGRRLATFDLAPLKAKIAQVDATSSAPAPRLGKILVEQQVLSPEELSDVLERQKTMTPTPPLGEMLVQEGKVAPQKVAEALVKQLTTAGPGAETAVPETVKVDLAKVDNLVDLMGELVIVQSQVRQNRKIADLADQKLERDLGQMARITSDLQKISMSLRMVPIGATFRKMVRLVRDLSHKVGKDVDLLLEGEDTEIDRSMVEAIYDPLVHLVRNSVDHGLETPEERQAQGKPPTGHLWLRAFHQGGDILIEIEDDGRGLNREAILVKATDRGLIPPGQTLSPERIDHLIFEPGFSTAATVTEISGRGVGLDVVKQNITRLRGKIDIFSRTGEGCRFLLRLPLTLAIIDGMVVQVGSERYILPTVGVQETMRPSPADYFTVQHEGELIRVREELMPLMRLHRLFGVGDREIHPSEALVMVVEHEGEKRALLVDDILGKQEIVIKSLGYFFKNQEGLAGGTILGDGRVGLILDLAGLFHLEYAGLLFVRVNRGSGPFKAQTTGNHQLQAVVALPVTNTTEGTDNEIFLLRYPQQNRRPLCDSYSPFYGLRVPVGVSHCETGGHEAKAGAASILSAKCGESP